MMNIGRKNLNWIKRRDDFIFLVSSNISLAVILYIVRKDFTYHWVLALMFILALFYSRVLNLQKRMFLFIGQMNSKIILVSFYFVFFTPFSILYKLFFRHSSFKDSKTSFVVKKDRCDFERPF